MLYKHINMKWLLFVLGSALVLTAINGTGCTKTNQIEIQKREYIYWEKEETSDKQVWKKYETSSEEGLKEVDAWVKKHRRKLDIEVLAMIPSRVLYYNENDELKNSYCILEWYPKDSRPITEREFVEHIPKEEIELLIKTFTDHGTMNEFEKGPYP